MPSIQDYIDDVVADGPLLYWPLLETTGTTATDSSGNALDGSVDTGGTWAVSSPSQSRGQSCFEIPTTKTASSYLGYTGSLDTNNGTGFSIEFWMKPTGTLTINGPRLFSGSGLGAFEFIHTGTSAQVGAGTSVTGKITLSSALVINTWAYWVFTQDNSGSSRLYKNGALVGGPSTQTHPADLADIKISNGGVSAVSSNWQHLAIHPTVLTATQVSDRYALIVDDDWNVVVQEILPYTFTTYPRSMPAKGSNAPTTGQVWPR